MSSTTIEKEIVQLMFEAKDFRKGIRESMEALADFKKGFEFNSANQSMSELQKSANVDFSIMADGIASINSKMSLMGIAAAAIIADIATSILDLGKSMVDTLVMTPLTDGLAEYETQLNAVQTILANTAKAGTTLVDVTDALDELNTYADLTIYNFTQMVDSIGKFTTAGVDLETSTAAIKGIANVAALSGSNATQASTAMYQLSQAISSGIVRLQDWMSVEKAGMGGVLFQESLMETARIHGVAVDKMVEDSGSFRNSLAENWLTSDVLLDTLSKFTGDLSDAQLEALGYTQEQIDGIQQTATLALDAATKVKTLTALKDTMAEALGSGWSASWVEIFGDFEEAKVFWGAVAEFFGDIISSSSDARNRLLSFWKLMGGRNKAIEGLFNILNAAKNILGAFGDAIQDVFRPLRGADLLNITDAFLSFSEKIKMASENTDTFKRIIRGFAAAFDIVRLVVVAILKPILALIPGLQAGAGGFFEWLAVIGDIVFGFRNFATETGFFHTVVANVLSVIKEFRAEVRKIVDSFIELEVIQDVIGWFQDIKRSDVTNFFRSLLRVLSLVIAPFYLLATAAQNLYKEIIKLEAVKRIGEWFEDISWEQIKESIQGIADGIKEFVEGLAQSDLLGKFIELVGTFDGRRFSRFFSDAEDNFGGVVSVIEQIKEALGGIDLNLDGLTSGIKAIGTAIGDGLHTVLDYLIENADNIDYSQLFDVINAGLLSGVLLSIRNLFKDGLFSGLFGDDLTEGVGDILESMEGTLTSFQNNIKADTLQKIAVAIAVLAGSIFLMTLIDSTKLLSATAAIAGMLAALFGTAGAMRLIRTQDTIKAALAIVGLSLALTIASIGLSKIAKLEPDEIERGMLAMVAALTALVISIRGISAGVGAGFIKTVGLIIGMSFALTILGGAIRTFGEMDQSTLTQGMAAVAASLALLVTALTVLSVGGNKSTLKSAGAIVLIARALDKLADSVTKFGEMDVDTLKQGLITTGIVLAGFAVYSRLLDPKGMLSAALAMAVITGAMVIMVNVVRSFASFSWEELLRGLVGLAGALAILVIAANAMTGALAGAAAALVMSIAIIAIAGAMKLLSTLTWEEVLLSLVALAGVFLVLGVAGALLTPVVPTLLLLGVAMLLIGAGAALMGVGLLAASVGLVAIAGSAVAIGAAIRIVGGALIDVLPNLAKAFGEALVNFITAIADNAPEIFEGMKTLILGMIRMVTELIPEIVDAIFEMIEAIITTVHDRMPDLVQKGWEILQAFVKGIRDHLPEIVAMTLETVVAVLQEIARNMPDIIQAGWDILLAIIKGIEDNIADLVTTVLNTITTLLETIADELPEVVQAGFDVLLAFLQGIADNVDEIVTMGFEIVVAIIRGLVDGYIILVNAAFEFIITFLNGIADAIEENMADIIAAGIRIGEAIVDGLVVAIENGLPAVAGAVRRLAQAALNALIDTFINFSPSRATYEIAENVVKGFVNGIADGVRDVVTGMTEFGQRARKELDPVLRALGDEIDGVIEFNPVITPVMNLDEIESGIGILNSSFDSSRVLGELSYAGNIVSDNGQSANGEGGSGAVVFNQYNYSPKALDRETIYRQTKTQVAKLSHKAFE